MKTQKRSIKAVELLNQVFQLEYSLIVHYPHFAELIPDEETKTLVRALGKASIRHADVIAKIMTNEKEKFELYFEPFPNEQNLVKIFEIQLEKEQQAEKMHREIAGLMEEKSSQQVFEGLAREEAGHINMVQHIIKHLKSS